MTKYIIAFLILLISFNGSLKSETVKPVMATLLPEVNNAAMMDFSAGEIFVLEPWGVINHAPVPFFP